MEKVIWGAGYTGSKLLHSVGRDNISFYIDRNPLKSGNHLEKRVLLPDDVSDWGNLFIYVPFNYYDEIRDFLLAKGLKENDDFVKYGNTFQISQKSAEMELHNAFQEIDCVAEQWKHGVLYFTSQFLPELGCLNFLKRMSENKLEFHLVSEAYWMDRSEIKKRTKIEEKFLIVPSLWELHSFVPDSLLSKAAMDEIDDEEYLAEIVEQVQGIFPSIKRESCYYLIYYNYRYISEIIEKIQPNQIIYSSGVKPSGRILSGLCQEKSIPLITSHPGVIPGTLSYDSGGEMGASLPAIYSKNFINLPVNQTDLQQTKATWKYLYKSRLNRKIQPQNECLKKLKEQIDGNRPTIFFAAQNDPDSYMIPYTKTTRKYHSPIFHTSLECGIYLAQLCERNGWNIIFKPHPLYVKNEWKKQLPPNVVYMESGDINDIIDFADVTITILSATSYNALIRYKPVVMLGYTQLRGKGCTYEAFEKDKIEDAIKAALENGFTQEQQDAFLLHMAQCLKYYLYDDLQERPIRYGRPVPKSMDEFYELERLLKM